MKTNEELYREYLQSLIDGYKKILEEFTEKESQERINRSIEITEQHLRMFNMVFK